MSDPTDRHAEAESLRWYDLFSRGGRDWLRHNRKVRDAVREHLPEIISDAEILGGSPDRVVRVPVRFLEHYRFRLREDGERRGVGQGEVEPGDLLAPPGRDEGAGKGQGGSEDGGVRFVLEFRVDDIVDWLWEELELPNLEARTGGLSEEDYRREGWSRRGVRSRLDRRRSLKEAIKRRAVQPDAPPFTDEDLRYRQLVKRQTPTTQAVVFLVMDVSASMSADDRRLAKTFFFWAIQGLRRRYRHLDAVFVAHTSEAWEFEEEEFFQVSGSGGTIASTALRKVQEVIAARYDPGRYNVYLFYASDGDNFPADRVPARRALTELATVARHLGYLEISPALRAGLPTEMGALFAEIALAGAAASSHSISSADAVWDAIRAFFSEQAPTEIASG